MNYNKELTESVTRVYDLKYLLYKYFYNNEIFFQALIESITTHIPLVDIQRINDSQILLLLKEPVVDVAKLENSVKDLTLHFITTIRDELDIKIEYENKFKPLSISSSNDILLNFVYYNMYTVSIIDDKPESPKIVITL